MDATNKLKSGETYDNGFLKISGNVPIHAQLAQSKTTVDSAMAGNWGVMARITLPAGVDAKSLGGAVDWSGSYFYLDLQTIKALGFQLKNINFPLQFAHHVYLDPDHANVFYLKVKGIPFGYTASDNGTAATMKLLDNADTRDYLNNVYLDSSGQPSTLDQIGSPSTIDGHLNFPTQTGGKSTIWDPYYGLVKDTFSSWWPVNQFIDGITSLFSGSPIYETGSVGRAITLLNAADPSDNRSLVKVDGGAHSDCYERAEHGRC